jgi:alkylhydroperoxidase family enzyme
VSVAIPRVEADALPRDLAATLRPRVDRLGYLGEFFKCAAHQPAALMSFMAFTEDLKRALPDRITELVALTVSTELGNAYERHQHERLSIKLGFGESWIRSVEALSPPALPDVDRAVQQLTLSAVRRYGHGTARELDAVVAAIGHEQAIAVLMLIGRYVTHALMVNALELKPPVASPLT